MRALFGLCVLVVGCEGQITPGTAPAPKGGGGSGNEEPVPLVAQSLCTAPAELAPTRQLRLNRAQYTAALNELFGTMALATVASELAAIPDSRAGQFSSLQLEVSSVEVDMYHSIAFALAFYVADRPAERGRLEPCLANAPIASACVQQFLSSFGRRVFRRPMQPEDLARLNQAYQLGAGHSPEEGVGTVILTALTNFEFLFRVEAQGTPGAVAGTVELTPYELATRVSFALVNAPPDRQLLDAAARGLNPSELSAEVDRMLDDARARQAMGRFYGEWLGTAHLPALPPHVQSADEPRLLEAIRSELNDFTAHVTFDKAGGYRELLTDRTTFVGDSELGALLGVSALGKTVAQQLPSAERAGVLTRPGWLLTAPVKRSNAGHLIKRGAHIGQVLCRPLPPPNPDLFPPNDPADPGTNPNAAIRERFRAITSQVQCVSCHTRLDAWGGAFGHYSSAGEYLRTEAVFDAAGVPERQLPIDSAAVPNVDYSPEAEVADAVALSDRLGASLAGPQCMAKQLATHFSGRTYSAAEGCWVEEASSALRHGSIKSALKALVMAPQFRLKKL